MGSGWIWAGYNNMECIYNGSWWAAPTDVDDCHRPTVPQSTSLSRIIANDLGMCVASPGHTYIHHSLKLRFIIKTFTYCMRREKWNWIITDSRLWTRANLFKLPNTRIKRKQDFCHLTNILLMRMMISWRKRRRNTLWSAFCFHAQIGDRELLIISSDAD